MKFLLFSDLHHHPGVFRTDGFSALRTFKERALKEGCDMMIHAGDFCHNPKACTELIDAYRNMPFPTYHCLGNHDFDGCSAEETLLAYGLLKDYYFFDMKGYRFIVTNPNYYLDGDEYVIYSKGNYYKHSETREYIPTEQLLWLEKTIEESPFPSVIISHPSFERCDGVKNRNSVREIVLRQNKKRRGSVIMLINGHHHRNYVSLIDGVIYLDMNSASYDWVEKTHDKYPREECEKYRLLNHTLVFSDPLSAVITLDGRTVSIQGIESSMYLGVTRKMIDCREYDDAGRPLTPSVQSVKITLE